MTKRELMTMIANMRDDEEVNFVGEYIDRDGYPYDVFETKVYKVVGENAKKVRKNYGIIRIENE
jgi:hypothetical protein